MRTALTLGPVYLNPIIYAEVAAAFDRPEELDRRLDALSVERSDIPYKAAFLASKAFLKYRRAGGIKISPLPDFFIGAHAATDGLTLITRDASRFRTYFPDVRLVTFG